MKITDLLDKRSISLDAAPASKSEALDLAVELMAASGKLSDVEAYRRQVYAREEESTTGIGEGIAIPHGKSSAVKRATLAAMVVPEGVDFESADGGKVQLMTRQTPLGAEVIVMDDGVGFDPERLPQDGREHFGLQLVRDRLRMVCGARLTVESGIGQGTVVRVYIPSHAEDSARNRYGKSRWHGS